MKKKNLLIGLEEPKQLPHELVEEYLQYKELSGCSQFTINNQRGVLKRYMTIYSDKINSLKEQHESILRYLQNKKNAYFNKELDALRQFWKFYYNHIDSNENPCAGIAFKAHSSNRMVNIDAEVIKQLIKAPNQKLFIGLRDYVFMILMLDTGIRPQEALRLKINDIGVFEKTVYVREEYAKTRQPRNLPISIQTVALLRKLIAVRHKNWHKNGEVFCTFSGDSLTAAYLQERFRSYSKKIGYSITPYQLRHIFALGFIKNGGDPFTLQRIMGHTRLDQTRAYINLIRIDLVNNHTKSTPLNQFLREENRVTKIRGNYAKQSTTFQEFL